MKRVLVLAARACDAERIAGEEMLAFTDNAYFAVDKPANGGLLS